MHLKNMQLCCMLQDSVSTNQEHDTRWSYHNTNEKSAQEATQTLRTGCSKVEQNFFAITDPFPGAQDSQNLIGWRWSLPSPTDRVW